jgi:outer membrane protein OmpA-like peptidoglycan-associated protein
MTQKILYKIKFIVPLVLLSFIATAQNTERNMPIWWFGISGAANMNYYRGTTQKINSDLMVPTAFHDGITTRPYVSILTEYRPNKVIGLMLNIAFDNRGGVFDQVVAPCNCPADLSTNLSYVAFEPSLRIAPFKNSFYVFLGPTFDININKEFRYTEFNQPKLIGDWGNINKSVIAGQAGFGFDIPVSAKLSDVQMTISPFASFQSDLFQAPRSIETWSIYSVRTGIALKLGYAKRKHVALPVVETNIVIQPSTNNEVVFSVRAPKVFPEGRKVKETFPLRNSIFFDMGNTEISNRYILLNKMQAADFKESKLQQGQPDNLYLGRSARQLEVYHNILNIIGDRMRNNSKSSIVLVGSADKNPIEGKLLADHVKDYLVLNYEINASRITTLGRDKPVIPSEQPGSTNYLDLLREGDRRVDIESNADELLMEVGGVNLMTLKPVQIYAIQSDPLDNSVIFNVVGGASNLDYWNIDLINEQGQMQRFGPYIGDHASVPGNIILGNNTLGNYEVTMVGVRKNGAEVRRKSSVSLTKTPIVNQEGIRYSILFDFDKSKTVVAYENFLKNIVTPLIPDNATVIIHGHTDIIGDVKYNMALSLDRALSVKEIIKSALTATNKKNVKFDTYGFGKDTNMSPFENNTPEERFYNRTVIIDIIPDM